MRPGPSRTHRGRLCACAVALLAAACEGRPLDVPADAGEPLGIASTAQIVAWEGQSRFVTVLSAETGDPFDGARVEVLDPAGPLEIVEQRCAGTRCAVVLRVLDQVANTGQPIPPPIAVREAYLVVRLEGADRRALLRVMPLDTIGGGGTTPLRTGGVRFASSAEMADGAIFAGEGDPIRWVVFGDARLPGTIAVSAEGSSSGPGGYAGGTAGSAGRGPGGGGVGEGGAGGGGGGHALAGANGQGPAAEPDGGGAGGEAALDLSCAADFFASRPCGGSGGGGATGAGGGGGGALAIVVLGALDLGGARLTSVGGAGQAGAGGGAGGVVALAASSWVAPSVLDVEGGAGEGAGGAGGAGAVQIQVPGSAREGAWLGPAVDLADVPSITDRASITLRGSAAPGAGVVVERLDGTRFTGSADAAGAFSLAVELAPGLNRMRVTQELGGVALRSWVGTSIELERRTEPDIIAPTGALIDVARVP